MYFDLDGTLADTVESIARGVNLALVQLGYEPRAVEEFNYYAGRYRHVTDQSSSCRR